MIKLTLAVFVAAAIAGALAISCRRFGCGPSKPSRSSAISIPGAAGSGVSAHRRTSPI